MTIKTLLFDLDGTLIDSNELIVASFQHTFKEHLGRDYTKEEILPFIGPPLKDTMDKLDEGQSEQMMKTYREHNALHHDAYIEMYDGVYETIKSLHEFGYPMAIVTTKIEKTARKGLELTGLDEFFDVVIGLDHVSQAKPDPEPVLKGMHALNGTLETTLMVGDNSHDIHAGQNAGTKTAAVGWSAKGRDYMESLNPDYVLNHISDLIDIIKE
ncbi:pyrophosphatase PpaX [Alkalibacillus filiformis]|uniref:Pyrophosphatase PpaX n=1 Tax=Alkalibacillus filiformis TaxID=200990 RepID=A0ABU0DVQ7_9BACI|nr:pyrophosphatase PpaX [Alkalibacillus filiformis]MDQ0352544.1 pyrophosphatase PpaX [Alkalibacillus filiformis]